MQVKFFVSKATTQTTCLRLMGKKMLVALMMEGKFSGEGIHSLESDEDMMSAMARELVERGRVGESADAVWADLKRERAQHMPSMPWYRRRRQGKRTIHRCLFCRRSRSQHRHLHRISSSPTRRGSRSLPPSAHRLRGRRADCCSSPEPFHVSPWQVVHRLTCVWSFQRQNWRFYGDQSYTSDCVSTDHRAPSSPAAIATDHSLLELDFELDALLDQIQDEIEEQGEASAEAMERFQLFCQAMDVKIDRIGRFLRVMETRAEYCKKESARYAARARRAQSKIERTESMVLYYLASHDLKKIESHEFTLKRNKNSQDSVEITQPEASPIAFGALKQRLMVHSGSK